MSILPPNVIQAFVYIRVVNCTTIAAVTVLIWDYFITLPDEVALVWPSSWKLSKFLFLLNRYMAFVDPIMLLHVLMFENDAKVCIYHFRILGYFVIAGYIVGQFILILRAYAVWGDRSNKLFAVVIGMALCIFAVSLWIDTKYIGGVYSTGVPTLGMIGCTLIFKNRLAWIDFILITVVESASTGLMAIKAVQYFRVSRSSLMTTIYQDGLLYFACILVTTIANLFVIAYAPGEINGFMVVVQRVLHSVLCSRVLLHIRSAFEAQNRHIIDDSLPLATIAQADEPLNDSQWPSDRADSKYGGGD